MLLGGWGERGKGGGKEEEGRQGGKEGGREGGREEEEEHGGGISIKKHITVISYICEHTL